MIGQAMNDNYSKWSDVRAKGRAVDPRPPAEQAAGNALARERHVRLTAVTADVLRNRGPHLPAEPLARSAKQDRKEPSQTSRGWKSWKKLLRGFRDSLGEGPSSARR